MISDGQEERLFLIPAAHRLYLQILAGESASPPASPELEQLLGVDLVAPDRRRPGHYVALDVESAIRGWQTRLQTVASSLLSDAQSVPVQLRELATAYRLAHPGRAATPGVEEIVGYESINARLGPLVESCTVEAMTAHPTGPRPAHMLARSYAQDLPMLERGVVMRTIYLPTVRTDAPTARWAQTMTEQGAQVRTGTDFCRVIIIDRHTVVTSVQTPWEGEGKEPDRALFITDPDLVGHFVIGFERDWTRAEPWDGIEPGIELDELRKGILDCLARGLEQDEAAAELHVSRRTVTSRLAELREVTKSASLAQLMYWWGLHKGQH